MAALRMPFWSRSLDPQAAIIRLATPNDAAALRSLARQAQWSYLTSGADEVSELAQHDPTMLLLDQDRLVAAAQVGWRLSPNAWLRTVLVNGRGDVDKALERLLPALHQTLPSYGLAATFVTLDAWSEPWLRAPLDAAGYRWIMDVWGYAKHRPDVPSHGNRAISVRPAEPRDLPQILAVDLASFPTPWAKGAEILGPAIDRAPSFLVAEWDNQVIGYTYTSVYGGWQAHLVRIAVLPSFQGAGIGVRLLAEVARFCRHRRIELLTLNTQATNTQAQRLYEWFGFERTGDVQTVLGRE